MRFVVAILLIVYLIGVGVVLAPTIRANWSSASTEVFFGSIANDMPRALEWPALVYRHAVDRG
jgi:hypothetical protein